MNDKILEYTFGSYHLIVAYRDNNFAQVSMIDNGSITWPLIWSTTMSKEQAAGAIELFKQIGYYDMPIVTA